MRKSAALLLLLAAPLSAVAQVNDAFNTPTSLTLNGGVLAGSTLAATAQPGEVGISAFATGKSVWFRFTTSQVTRFNAKTEGSEFDTTLALYRGANLSETRLVAGNDDSAQTVRWSQIDVTVGPGSYWLALDSFGTASGNYMLAWQAQTTPTAIAVPSNDNFSNAIDLVPGELGASAVAVNSAASSEPAETGSGARSLWYKFTASRTRSMRVRTIDSQFDSQVDVYTGAALGSLSPVVGNDDIDYEGGDLESELGFIATQGTTYFVRLSSVGSGHGSTKLVVAPAKTNALPGIDAAYAGTWWNPLRDGEGIVIDIGDHPDPASQEIFVFFTWYTYDPDGRPVYLVGGVPRSALANPTAEITIPVVSTRGARFGAAFNSAQVVREPWGSVSLRFGNCGSLTLGYNPTVSGWGAAGTINMERILSRGPGQACP